MIVTIEVAVDDNALGSSWHSGSLEASSGSSMVVPELAAELEGE